MAERSINSLSDIVAIHNPVLRSTGVLAALSGLSTRLPITPVNQVLSFTLLSMTILLWLELRSRITPMISHEDRFIALVLSASGQVLRLAWFVILLDVAACLSVVIWLMAYPSVTSRLLLIEVFVMSVPIVVSKLVQRVYRSRTTEQTDPRTVGMPRHWMVGAGYLLITAPLLLIACIYVPNLVTLVRDGLGLQP